MARYGDRYENCGDAVMDWYENTGGGEGTSTFDICDKCIVSINCIRERDVHLEHIGSDTLLYYLQKA